LVEPAPAGAGAGAGGGGAKSGVEPAQLAREMIGQRFVLTRAAGGLEQGTTVVIREWRTDRDDVVVYEDGDTAQAETVVAKANLTTKIERVEGMTPYLANPAIEKTRNDALVRETQYNRFDALIKREVDAANAANGYAEDPLDPNIVKSMIFQESRMGTSGVHLDPYDHNVKTRFNVGQVIDSHGEALLHLMKRERPEIYAKYQLDALDAELQKPQYGLAKADYQRFAEIAKASRISVGEVFIQTFSRDVPANLREFQSSQFALARKELFETHAGGEPDRNETYEFWIHAMIGWLFEKRRAVKSWSEAVRAYNGSGPDAEAYKTKVTSRVTVASAARTAGAAIMPNETDGGAVQKPIADPAKVAPAAPPSPSITAPTPAPPADRVALGQVPYARIGPRMRIQHGDQIYFTGVVVPGTAASFVLCDSVGYVLDRHTTQPARINGVIHHEPEAYVFRWPAGQYFIFTAYWGLEPEGSQAGTPRAVDNHLVGMVEVLAGGEDWRRGGR
jgi:hypothetical protein